MSFNLGMIVLWNWIIGLILTPVISMIENAFLKHKFGKDVLERCTEHNEFRSAGEAIFCMGIIGFTWEFTLPIGVYLVYNDCKRISEIMKGFDNKNSRN